MAAAELEGGTLVVLTPSAVLVGEEEEAPGAGWFLVASPDHTSVAVAGAQGVRVISRDGTVRSVADGMASEAAWSPDGRAIAYVTDGRLRLVELAGGTSSDVAERAITPYFSQDGRTLAYTQYPEADGPLTEPRVRAVALG